MSLVKIASNCKGGLHQEHYTPVTTDLADTGIRFTVPNDGVSYLVTVTQMYQNAHPASLAVMYLNAYQFLRTDNSWSVAGRLYPGEYSVWASAYANASNIFYVDIMPMP